MKIRPNCAMVVCHLQQYFFPRSSYNWSYNHIQPFTRSNLENDVLWPPLMFLMCLTPLLNRSSLSWGSKWTIWVIWTIAPNCKLEIWPVFYFESWTHYYIKKLLQLYFKLWKEFPIKTKIPQKYTLKSETNWGNLADRWPGPKHFDLSPNYCHLGNKITRDTRAGEALRAE